MTRLVGIFARSRPLDEVWADTRPGIHSVGGCRSSADSEIGAAGSDRTVVQAARRALTKATSAWRALAAHNGNRDPASDRDVDLSARGGPSAVSLAPEEDRLAGSRTPLEPAARNRRPLRSP